MIVEPKVRGFICTTSHPTGCAQNVKNQIDYVERTTKNVAKKPKNVLVIGASTGYGLASRIVAGFGFGAKTIGLFFEKPASGKRTASAGWYNSTAFEQEAKAAGLYAKSINGDAFSNEIKQQTIDAIKADFEGKVDLVVYSLASPKRKDPNSDTVYSSVLKPVGETITQKTIDVMTGVVSDITIEPATEDEVANTVKVMGGEDWELWLDLLIKEDLLADDAKTLAYSYIGPEMTYPIYHNGTIGRAKEDLDRAAVAINEKLKTHCNGQALISVNKGLVTQASSAIPVVPLYISLLYKVMKQYGNHEGCIEQMQRLFMDRLYSDNLQLDSAGRIRIDDWELEDKIQAEVKAAWDKVSTDNINELADLEGYRRDFYQLFGFEVDGIDYSLDVEV